ncbi:TPA: hypothetical protein TXL63_000215 [Streptococcus suis]|nr:hypothetical protein [Streptococcus suis]
MMRQEKRFPLVADDEVLVGDNPKMNLYDEQDLISNIRGTYHEKDFSLALENKRETIGGQIRKTTEKLLHPKQEQGQSRHSRKDRLQQFKNLKPFSEKTQGQLARERAREDLKKKKSATYLREEKLGQSKVAITKTSTKGKTGQLSHLADKLRQTDYILADLPAVYSLKKEDREQGTSIRKNSYDFLKKSQVYNYPERHQKQERRIAQELNLTEIEERTDD